MARAPRNERRIAFIINEYSVPFARIHNTLAINAHRENISDELVRLTNRARPVVVGGRPVKEAGDMIPVGNADIGKGAPHLSTALACVSPVTVISFVVAFVGCQSRPRTRADLRLSQLAFERHSVTVGAPDENIKARLPGLSEKTNLELKLGSFRGRPDKWLSRFCFDVPQYAKLVVHDEIPEQRLRQRLRTGHAAKPPMTTSTRYCFEQSR
jgi:hypothetical protein